MDGIVTNLQYNFFHSADDDYPWMMLHVASDKLVTGIEIVGRSCCGSYDLLRNIEVRAGNIKTDGAGSGLGNKLSHNRKVAFWAGPGEAGATNKIDFICPQRVKYITIQIIESDNFSLQINEVRMVGYIDN